MDNRAAFEAYVAELAQMARDPQLYTAIAWGAWQAATLAERERLLAIAKSRADHEAKAAVHHAGTWYAAHEYHMNRHCAMRNLIEDVWPEQTSKGVKSG